VDALWNVVPWLFTMTVLMALSGFFSASEAALFSLRAVDRRRLAAGSRAQQAAARLLQNPDRLLSAVLFWNLVVNIMYFAIAAMVGARWNADPTPRIVFGVGSLLAIIFFSEMVPKSIAVMRAPWLAAQVSIPLTVAIRMVDPFMPFLRTVNLMSRRLIWPDVKEQPYLEIRDLERAIELSTEESEMVRPEKTVLRNIVQLSDLRVQEWMRPRKQFRAYESPVSLRKLKGQLPPSGYLLVTESDGDEIAAALSLAEMTNFKQDNLEQLADPVTYVPWCATVADALQLLHQESSEVAAVVNERGETIGIVTLTDIFDAILSEHPERSERLLHREAITKFGPRVWHVSGMTNVRRLERQFQIDLPANRNVTIAGVVQEELDSHAKLGDRCRWGPFAIEVISIDEDGELLLRLEWRGSDESQSK